MNNKMKRLSSLLLLLVFCITFIFAGCGKKSVDVPVEKKTVEIKDSRGEAVTIPREPQRVVVLNCHVAEVIYMLGEEDKIVGISDTTKFPEELASKEKVGKESTPDIEKVLELKPDIVFGNAYSTENLKGNIEKFNAAGIPFVGLDCFKTKTLENEVRILGTIFNKKQRAEEYINFTNKYLELVGKRVKNIETDKKVRVYYEQFSDYNSGSKGSSIQEIADSSGVINIASNEPVPYPKVSDEWIIKKNPDIVIRIAASKLTCGYGVSDVSPIKGEKDKIIGRTGWNKLDAIKNDKVYVMSNNIVSSPQGVVGICYIVKWAYPDLFKDLDPEAVHKELLEKFYKIDYKGIWVCH